MDEAFGITERKVVCNDSQEFEQYPSGATRSKIKERYDLLPLDGIRRAALAMAEGARKHGEQNWRKGIPIGHCINHCFRHLVEYQSGDTSEDHIAHAICNLLMAAELEDQ